jgi:nicotinate phosphoribosyltransferase
MLSDFYQFAMMQGYFRAGQGGRRAVFEMFIRENPGGSGFTIFAGLEQFVEYLQGLSFGGKDIDFLRSLEHFDEDFLEFLREFRFTGSVSAMREGSVCFPGEPLVIVDAPLIQGHFVETALLTIINHQSLIATKAARVCYAAAGDDVLEFGLRRAQGPDAGLYGARAAYIGGCAATSNVLAGQKFGLPLRGTHSHSWILSFENELEAFRHYAAAFPDKIIFLVDTYDTINSGLPNAIRVFNEIKSAGKTLNNYGIRLDSGDFAYLSKIARRILDEEGHEAAKITASGDLDENLIQSLKLQGARVDMWGVGTRMITSRDAPALGGVYKLCAIEEGGEMRPRMKFSDNPEKVTTPGIKKIYRIFDSESHKIKADLVTLADEKPDDSKDLSLFDPKAPWKTMNLRAGEFYSKEMLIPIISGGKRVSEAAPIAEIRDYCAAQQDGLWEEYRRLVNPHIMPVDLSKKLFDLKNKILFARN